MKVSIAIPCYEMHGYGADCLDFGLQSIACQNYTDFEVIISDHSVDDSISNVCKKWQQQLPLKYIKNDLSRGSSSANINNCIRYSTGDIVKILCQDDYFYDNNSLKKIVTSFGKSQWLVSSYLHTTNHKNLFKKKKPFLNKNIATINTIGTHSCLTIRKSKDIHYFDENLLWLMDCEYYYRLYNSFGPPQILNQVTMVQYLWEGQVTNTFAASRALRSKEIEYVKEKCQEPIKYSSFFHIFNL